MDAGRIFARVLFIGAVCWGTMSGERHQKGVPPTITRFAELTMVPIGRYVSFECHVTGFPLPVIKWWHNNKILKADKKFLLRYYAQDNASSSLMLWIMDLAQDDLGEYECIATNKFGSAREKITLYGLSSPYLTEGTVLMKATVSSSPVTCRLSTDAIFLIAVIWTFRRWTIQSG